MKPTKKHAKTIKSQKPNNGDASNQAIDKKDLFG